MKTTLLLIRHGESVANAQRYFSGQTNVPLSELGQKQAEVTAQYLKDFPIDAFYASDLRRAYETGLAAAKFHDLPVIPSTHLREIDCGEWEGMTHDEISANYPEIYHTWRTDIGNVCLPGGETPGQVQERVVAFLDAVVRTHEGQTVCIASHGMAIRCFLMHVLGLPMDRMMEYPFASNASVTTVTWENGKFTLEEHSHDSHLEGMITHFVNNVV